MAFRTFGYLAALAIVLMLSGVAQAKRVALVIGNAAYRSAPALRNPVNDATRMTTELKSLGFEVLTGTDLDVAGMRGVVREFADAAEGADLALFFYAGHGLQVHGRNYLLPVDAAVDSESDLDFAAMDLDLVLRQMNWGAAAKIVLLDACRNNPFEGPLMRSMGATRSAEALGRGLARIDAAGGSLIAFATEPGAVAADGEGSHSPFAQALLNHLDTPGLEINVMMTRVRAEVFEATRYAQRPWTSSSLIGEVYLVPEAPGSAAPPVVAPDPQPAPGAAVEIAFWTAAERSGELSDYEAYLRAYPDGAFVALATNRLARMQAGDAHASVAGPETIEDEPESGDVRLTAVLPTQAEAAPEPPAQVPTLEEVEAALGLNRAKRREVQERLTILGFETRGADGIFEVNTRGAISSWQKSAGLNATGFFTAQGLVRLQRQTESKLTALREQRSQDAQVVASQREAAAYPAATPNRGYQKPSASQTAVPPKSPSPARSEWIAFCGEGFHRLKIKRGYRSEAEAKNDTGIFLCGKPWIARLSGNCIALAVGPRNEFAVQRSATMTEARRVALERCTAHHSNKCRITEAFCV